MAIGFKPNGFVVAAARAYHHKYPRPSFATFLSTFGDTWDTYPDYYQDECKLHAQQLRLAGWHRVTAGQWRVLL